MYSGFEIAVMAYCLVNAFINFALGAQCDIPILSAALGFASAICLSLFLLILLVDKED